MRRVNLTWQVWEKTKKNLSASPNRLYNRYIVYRYRWGRGIGT